MAFAIAMPCVTQGGEITMQKPSTFSLQRDYFVGNRIYTYEYWQSLQAHERQRLEQKYRGIKRFFDEVVG